MSIKIQNNSKTVSDEAVAKLQEELNRTNEVLKEIRLRPGEVDVRELSDQDFKQACYRFMNDTLNALNLQNQTQLDINIILLESLSAKKKQKVADALNGLQKAKDKDKS